MTTFGTSAYMKVLALNPQPRDTELRGRIWPTGENGYDFHKAMRGIATSFAARTVDWPITKARLKAIRKPAERRSATAATFALARWVAGRPIRTPVSADIRVSSPNELFSVKFSPDFEIALNGVQTRIHIWNTLRPTLRLREAIGALGLFVQEKAPNSIAVLSLRTNELFVPADYKSASDLARLVALDVERRMTRISAERSEETRKPGTRERGLGH